MATSSTARHQAMNYLSRREHSRLELEKKLLQKGWGESEVEAVLDQLEEDRLQCDERFAFSLLRTKKEAGYGPRWIRQDLLSRGVSGDIIDRVLISIEDWFDVLESVWQKKYGQLPVNPEEHAKQSRFLINKGFDAESVHRCLSHRRSR